MMVGFDDDLIARWNAQDVEIRQSSDKASQADGEEGLQRLQEDLTRAYSAVKELKAASQVWQRSGKEYDLLAAGLRERKKKHSELKVRCKELKQTYRERQATEKSLMALLDA